MARAVYSTCFIECQTGTTSASFIVPADHTAIVTTMTFWNRDSQPLPVNSSAFSVRLNALGSFIWEEPADCLESGIYYWSGRELFPTSMTFSCALTYYSFRANGYLLTAT